MGFKKKKEFNYFKSYVSAVETACESAGILKAAAADLSNIEKNVEEIHIIENKADCIFHELVNALSRAFITPLESEDLKLLGHSIDEVVDAVEDVVINLYILNVTSVREEAVEFAALVYKCCEALKTVVTEFEHYKKSKKIKDYIVQINDIEEQGDRLYHKAIRRLFTDGSDTLEIIKWRRIFELFEKCCDSCEDVADTIESVIFKNT